MKFSTLKNIFFPSIIFCLLGSLFLGQISSLFSQRADSSLNNLSYIFMLYDIVILLYLLFNKPIISGKLFTSMFVLLLSITISSYINFLFYKPSSISIYFTIISPLLTLLFLSAVKKRIKQTYIKNILLIILSLMAFAYFTLYSDLLRYLNSDSTITNSSYYLLVFLPFVLCLNNKILKYGYTLVIVVAVLYSTKRGGIIALGIGLLLYLFFSNMNRKKSVRLLLFIITSTIIVFLAYYFFVEVNNSNTEYLINRFLNMADDGGSGRTTVFANTFNMILTSDFPSIFLGHGWNSVLRDSTLKLSAHNDFLEVFYDFGLIVFLFYMYYFIALIKRLFKMIKRKSKYAGQFACATIIFFILSMVSHVIIYPILLIIIIINISYIDQLDNTEQLNKIAS